jgi:hypothetical protein
MENGDATKSVSLDFPLWQSRYRLIPTRSRTRFRPDAGQAALHQAITNTTAKMLEASWTERTIYCEQQLLE